jgi:uncharacterized protein (TIGR01777 family)
MKIVVSGASGLIGSALVPALKAAGHEVFALARPGRESTEPTIRWNPAAGEIDAAALEGCDAVVHLAGENIAAARWTPAFQARLRESRVGPTHLLAETLARLQRPPSALVCASAIGIYGDRGDERLTEDSAPGTGFLARLGCDWEAAADPARASGIRVVHLRFGVVLSPAGGALAKMLPVFKAGLGGRLGHGRQWWPWLSLADAVGIVQFALAQPDLRGPVNTVAPDLVTNAAFTQALACQLGRPARLPVPQMALRLMVGAMADEALLASARVEPLRLSATGYPYRHPELALALRFCLPGAATPPGSERAQRAEY